MSLVLATLLSPDKRGRATPVIGGQKLPLSGKNNPFGKDLGWISYKESLADDSFCPSLLYPFRWCHNKTVVPRLIFNRLEIHTVKIRIVEQFPDSKKIYHIPRSHPVLYDESRIGGTFPSDHQSMEACIYTESKNGKCRFGTCFAPTVVFEGKIRHYFV